MGKAFNMKDKDQIKLIEKKRAARRNRQYAERRKTKVNTQRDEMHPWSKYKKEYLENKERALSIKYDNRNENFNRIGKQS